MTRNIKTSSWLDYCYERGDDRARSYLTYEEWLNSLDNEDFLEAYNRVKEAMWDLD